MAEPDENTNKQTRAAKNHEVVSKRLRLISPLISLDPRTQGGDVSLFNVELKRISADSGISTRTLRRWVHRMRADPIKGLVPQYKGNTLFNNKRYSKFAEYVQRAIAIRVANTTITVDKLIQKLWQEYPESQGLLKRSTIQRYLQREHAGKRELNIEPALRTDGFFSRFVMERPLQLVQGDLKYLPVCKQTVDGKTKLVKSYFVAWIDDCSRYILAAGVFTSQEQYVVSSTLRTVVERFGMVEALYMDNGSIYNNRAVHFAASLLGIKTIHTRVRHSWAKGKIERLNKTIDQLCKDIEATGKTIDITALVKMVEFWVDKYNQTIHSDLEGKTPEQVFYSKWNEQTARFYSEPVIEAAFLDTVRRRVNKDGTVKYKKINYLLPADAARAGTYIELAVARTGQAVEISLIQPDLSLLKLKEFNPKGYANREVERRLHNNQDKLPEPKPQDRGAAAKVKLMQMLQAQGYNFNFGGRNDLLDAAADVYLDSGDLEHVAKKVKELLAEDTARCNTSNQQDPERQSGYACLLQDAAK